MIQNHEQELVPLASLRFADYNPREMSDDELGKLKRSLVEFGFVEPVVARREDGLVLGGHQRIRAMRELLKEDGQDPDSAEIPVVWLDGVDDDRAKLLNLALNKIHGDWDYTKLHSLLSELSEAGENDVGLSGFSQDEVSDILSMIGSDLADDASSSQTSDPDEELRRDARKFTFEVTSDEEAELCYRVLRKHGMTGPANIGSAFVSIFRKVSGE